MIKIIKQAIFTLSMLIILACNNQNKAVDSSVRIVGQMKHVMWKGELFGNIDLDTISNKEHLYGFGPLDYLRGELLIIDGRSYRSSVLSDTSMLVEETYQSKAPFFAFANIPKWKQQSLPDSVQNIQQLEQYLDTISSKSKRPFLFKLSGTVEKVIIHIVNLAEGSKVSSPDEAHQGRTFFTLSNIPSSIIGFFSKEHQAIFTHHDTFLHMHMISDDLKKMGHVDELLLKNKDIKLYLAAE